MTTTSDAIEEIQSDLVSAKVYRAPYCKLEIDATPSAALLQQGKKRAIKAVSKEVLIPGFRKGKAPDEMVMKRYPQAVEKEWQQATADVTLPEVLKHVKAPILRHGAMTYAVKGSFPSDAPTFHFTVETEPTIPDVDPLAFELKPVDVKEITEEQVDEAVRQMRFFYANWTQIEDRPIQDGDYILIDLDKMADGKMERVFNSIRFEMTEKRTARWMYQLLLGKKKGDIVEGISEPDADATEEMKPQPVQIHILKVEAAELPPLDDAFAEKVGSKSVDEMRDSVRKSLKRLSDQKADEQRREQVNHFLTHRYPFDLPHSLVDNEARHRFKRMMQETSNREEWEKMNEEQRKAETQEVLDDSASAVRLFYLARNVIEKAQITVSHQEIAEEANRSMSAFGSTPGEKISQEIYALALSKLILAKAQDYLIEAAQKRLTQP